MRRLLHIPIVFVIVLSLVPASLSQTVNTYGPLNLPNTWHNPAGSPAAIQTFQDGVIFGNITGSTQCLQVNSSGLAAGTGSACSAAAYTLEINGTGLSAGDTVNFNASTPAAPSNGYAITFATSKSGGTDSVSAAIVGDGNSGHCLLGTGVFGTCGSGSGITGSGTTGVVPTFTSSSSIGNSLITAGAAGSGGNVQIGYSGSGNALGGSVGLAVLTQTTNNCAGNVSSFPVVVGCFGERSLFNSRSSTTGGVTAGAYFSNAGPSVAQALQIGLIGIVTGNAGTTTTEERGVEADAIDTSTSATVTTRRALYALALNVTGNTSTNNEAIVAESGAISSTNTNDYTIHILAPDTFGGSTLTNHSGLQIDTQGTGDAITTGSDPVIFGGPTSVGGGTNIVYRCTTGGTLPAGALTIATGNCGASTDTGLRVE